LPILFGGLIGIGLLGWLGAAASAQESNTINVNVINRVEDDEGNELRQPVPGVTLTAQDEGGAQVAQGATDADGKVTLTVPGPQKYTVHLDQATLPEGVTLIEEGQRAPACGNDPACRAVDFTTGVSLGGGSKTVNFFLGEDFRETKSRWSLLPQTLANGVKQSLIIAICAIGLSLIYGTTGLSNFSHGEMVTLGAMIAWYFNQRWGELHLLLAALFGIAATAIAGGLYESGVWRPLRKRGTSLTSMMIVSIGLAITIRYVYLFIFDGRNVRYRQYVGQKEWDFGPFSLTPRDVTIIIISSLAVTATALFLLYTRTGRAIRAVSDNPDLSSATGINTNRIVLLVWVVGGALAGLGGVLFGAASGVQWDMGFNILLLMFAAITLGGLGNPFGALVGAFVVGIFIELWTWIFPSVIELKNVGALLTLIVVLLVRPQGILGRKERIG
jgi:branched-chain amino acid transport system permease protein